MTKAPRKPTKKRKRPAIRSPADSAAGRTNVLLEEIRQQQRVVIDAVLDLDRKVDRTAHETKRELLTEIDALKIAVRMNSADIQKNSADIQMISTDIQKLKDDTRDISAKLDVKADAHRVASLEGRVDVLETRLAD